MDKTLASIVAVLLVTIGAIYEIVVTSKAHRRHQAEAHSQVARPPLPTLNLSPASTPTGVAGGSCRPEDLRLKFPLGGQAEKDWLIANYFDTDPGIGRARDYTGAVGENAVTYDGHSGIDFEVASFREMDLGIPVLASADGVVEELNEKSSDHNTSCSSDLWNYVKLRHGNGFATIYGHLKKNSLMVKLGQSVTAGTPLGIVGSSGCSSYPHVHLETIDCQGVAFDAMQAQLFENPPTYSRDAPATLMETSIFQPAIKAVQSIQDPGPTDINLVSRGREFSVAMTVSHLRPGDTIRIEFLNPAGESVPFAYEQSVTRYSSRSHWWGNFHLDESGTWTILFKINGQIQLQQPLTAVD